MKQCFQVGIVVPDIQAAMRELEAILGVRWATPRVADEIWPGHTSVFSLDGPLYIELIQGGPGSPWDPTGGPRIDHIGFWTDDIEADKQRIPAIPGVEAGVAGLAGVPFAVFRGEASGANLEFIDSSIRRSWQTRWGVATDSDEP